MPKGIKLSELSEAERTSLVDRLIELIQELDEAAIAEKKQEFIVLFASASIFRKNIRMFGNQS